MYDHIVLGLKDLARSLRVSRIRRLTPKEIELIEQASVKFAATLRSLEDSRLSNQLLQTQLDRFRERIGPELQRAFSHVCGSDFIDKIAAGLINPEVHHVEDVG